MKVIIAGAGIGGLSAALALHARGIDCELIEQAEQVRELGVGINVLPHAIRVLADLGLLPALDRVGVRTRELSYLNRFGQLIWQELRGMDAGFPVPQFSIHRGQLLSVIHQAVLERIGPARIRTGVRVAAFHQDGQGVSLTLADRAGQEAGRLRGDLLIGADGIHSAVRAQLFPNEGPPRWNGIQLWRGAIDWPRFLDGRSMLIAGGMRAKAVLYPIAPGKSPDTRLLNWAIAAKTGDADTPLPRRESWSALGNRRELEAHLNAFAIAQLDVRALVAATEQFWEYPMCDRDPLPRWSHDRVSLLGDAAHPMYPVGSNGASQAILDAQALAECLSGEPDPVAALRAYEAKRLPATAAIVASNRLGGPEGVIDAVEALAPEGFTDIEAVMPLARREAIVRGYAQMAGFSREQVSQPPR